MSLTPSLAEDLFELLSLAAAMLKLLLVLCVFLRGDESSLPEAGKEELNA